MSSGSQSELPAGRAGDVFIIASLGPKVSGAGTLYAINDERRKDFVETERGRSPSGYVSSLISEYRSTDAVLPLVGIMWTSTFQKIVSLALGSPEFTSVEYFMDLL